jgi:hypothetical protein
VKTDILKLKVCVFYYTNTHIQFNLNQLPAQSPLSLPPHSKKLGIKKIYSLIVSAPIFLYGTARLETARTVRVSATSLADTLNVRVSAKIVGLF